MFRANIENILNLSNLNFKIIFFSLPYLQTQSSCFSFSRSVDSSTMLIEISKIIYSLIIDAATLNRINNWASCSKSINISTTSSISNGSGTSRRGREFIYFILKIRINKLGFAIWRGTDNRFEHM